MTVVVAGSASGVAAAPMLTGRDVERRFVGRRRELDALRAALEHAVAGQPRIVLLTGEPGIGKTRTAQEIVAHAGRSGVLALWGRCPEERGAPPYWPWLQLIRRYAALHDEQVLSQTIGSAATQIAALDAQLAHPLTDGTPGPSEADALNARFRLFDSIAGFWQRAAARQPLLLVLDDLHRADVPSLRLLEFVMAEAVASRLMVLGTYRDSEVVRQHPLSDTLAQLHRHAHVQRLLLGGFSPAETVEFVVAAGAPSTELAAALHDQTEGHPLFLAELTRDMLQARDARAANAGNPTQEPRGVPKGVREVIGARLNRLTPPCVPVLQNAAVIGREFGFNLLCGLLGDDVPQEQALAAIDEARTACLIDESAEPGAYQFSHALVRDTLYDELSALHRARLHQRIAAALELQHAGDLTPCLSALAHHYQAAGPAGDAAKAVAYATRAAELATAMQAHEEAVRHYLLACGALPPGAGTDAQRCRLLLGLGDAQLSAGDSALALATFADAASCARRVGDASLLVRSAIGFGNAQWRLGSEGPKAVVLIGEALAQAAPAGRERVSLLSALCRALLFSNRPDEAETAFREAVAIARRLGDPLALFGALSAIVPGRWFADRLALRIEAAHEAIELARRAGHPKWPVSILTGWHAGDLMEFGDTAAAAATTRLHLASGETTREPFIEAVALAALAMIATHEGRFAEAEKSAVQALRCGERFDRDNAAGIFGVQMFTLRRQQGRLRELAPVLKQFLASGSMAATWRPGLAILHCELGARDEARDIFDQLAARDFAGIANDAIRIASIAYLAEVCAWLGDAARAPALYALLLPYAERNIVFGAHTASFGAGARLLGMLATTLERWDAAEHHFEVAEAFDAHTGGRPWLARSRCEFAAMLMRRARSGDHDRALPLLEAALVDARELGMRGLEERAAGLQQKLATDRKPGGRRQEVHAAGLSKREVQVLRLVAAGKTNQEIATVLCRSPSTVAIHVRNILGKTQAANRAEAAAFAVRHGLLPPA
jgi:DNA-binding CsgD family transcriptional regulator